jgi:uncharacterized damage-inducible protein DinB
MMSDFATNDSGEREQYASGMKRDVTIGKTLWHLVASGPMMKRWAELMTRGAEKYGEDNWLNADSEKELKRFKSSAYRHFMQWYHGLDPDEDHAAAVYFNIDGAEYVKDRIEKSGVIRIPDLSHLWCTKCGLPVVYHADSQKCDDRG